MSDTWVNVALVLVFILIGGVFAATELALVSLREGQAKALAARGRRGERVARLVEDPNRFLAAVQVGVTLAGFLSAAFGAARLAVPVSDLLVDAGMTTGASDTVALVLVTLVISYFSLVFSELAPKRLALQRPEGIAMAFAPSLDRIATLSRPVIWLLSKSTDLVVRLLGGDPRSQGAPITEEELRDMVAAHESLTKDERKLIDDVFAAGERQLREVMLPRTEVAFLDAGMTLQRALRETAEQPHSRYPVAGTSQDDVIGFLHVRDLMVPAANARGLRVADVAREVKMLPASKKVLPAMSEMRREGHHMAIVVDEYGGTAGIVTLEDLIEEVIGDIRDEYDVDEGDPLEIRGGEVEADGLLHLDEVRSVTGVSLPDGPYETLAGYVMATLGHVPRQGEAVEVDGHRLEVSELDGRRIARVRVTPLEPQELGGDGVTAPVRSESRTPSPVAEVFDLLTSEGWVERKAARFSDGSKVVRREASPAGGLLLAVSRELPEGAPGFLTRLLPKDGRVVQTDEWAPDDGSGSRTGTWRVELAGAPVRLGGTMRIEPDGSGSAYVVVGETKVSVPLVGGKAESFIADMVVRLGRTEGDLLRTTLAQPGSS